MEWKKVTVIAPSAGSSSQPRHSVTKFFKTGAPTLWSRRHAPTGWEHGPSTFHLHENETQQ